MNDVYSCTGYATSGAQLDTSHARLDTSPLGSATINNLEQLHNESYESSHDGDQSGNLDVTVGRAEDIWYPLGLAQSWPAT